MNNYEKIIQEQKENYNKLENKYTTLISEFFFKKKKKKDQYKTIEPQISRKDSITKFTQLINKALGTKEEFVKMVKGKFKIDPKKRNNIYELYISEKEDYLEVIDVDTKYLEGKEYKGSKLDDYGDSYKPYYDLFDYIEPEFNKFGYSIEFDGDATKLYVMIKVGAKIKIEEKEE